MAQVNLEIVLWYNSAIFIVVLQIPAVNRDSRIKKRPRRMFRSVFPYSDIYSAVDAV